MTFLAILGVVAVLKSTQAGTKLIRRVSILSLAGDAAIRTITFEAVLMASLAVSHRRVVPVPDQTVAELSRGVSVQITFGTTIQGIAFEAVLMTFCTS